MLLHNEKNVFLEIINGAANYYAIPEEQIEKDYYVSHLLSHLVKIAPEIVFKGGTSLSKCYGIINRFSEDIDIHFASDSIPTQGERKKLKNSIFDAVKDADLQIINTHEIRSRRDYNNYKVSYPQVTSTFGNMREHLLLETYIPIKTFPTSEMAVSSYILNFLESHNEFDIIDKFKLHSFMIRVQNVERTLIDKIFAICDYYENNNLTRNSRHLYDVHKIFENTTLSKSDIHNLFKLVRAERIKKPEMNISSSEGYRLKDTLKHILESNIYKDDYDKITRSLLFEDISYNAVKLSIEKLIDAELIPY